MMLKKVAILVTVLSLALISAAVVMARFSPSFSDRLFYFFNAFYLQLPGDKSGKGVILQAAHTLETAQSAEITIQGQLETIRDQQSTSNVVTTHTVGSINLPNARLDQMEVQTHSQAEVVLRGFTFNADVETISTLQTLYFKVNQFPQLPSLNQALLTSGWFKTFPTQNHNSGLKDVVEFGTATRQNIDGKKVFVVPVNLSAEQTAQLTEMLFGEPSQLLEKVVAPISLQFTINSASFQTESITVTLPLSFSDFPQRERIWSVLKDRPETGVVTVQISFQNYGHAKPIVLPQDAQDFSQVYSDLVLKSVNEQGVVLGSFDQIFDPPITTPRELKELTPYQKNLLKQQGLEIEEVIP